MDGKTVKAQIWDTGEIPLIEETASLVAALRRRNSIDSDLEERACQGPEREGRKGISGAFRIVRTGKDIALYRPSWRL